MAIKILHDSDPTTRNKVITAFQSGSTIGWVIDRGSGVVYDPTGSPNQKLASDVAAALAVINATNSLQIQGNAGISILNGILQSTCVDPETGVWLQSDDYVTSQLISGIVFVGDSLFVG